MGERLAQRRIAPVTLDHGEDIGWLAHKSVREVPPSYDVPAARNSSAAG